MSDSDEELDEADEDSNGKFFFIPFKNEADIFPFQPRNTTRTITLKKRTAVGIHLSNHHRSADSITFEDEFHEGSDYDDYLDNARDPDF